MGGLEDTGAWRLGLVLLATVAGFVLAAVAASLARRRAAGEIDFLTGYDACTPSLYPNLLRREESL